MPDRWITDSTVSERFPFYTRANSGEIAPFPGVGSGRIDRMLLAVHQRIVEGLALELGHDTSRAAGIRHRHQDAEKHGHHHCSHA